MRTFNTFFVVCVLMFPGTWSHAGEYSGQWEYRALNAGDTNFNVEQTGDHIKLYRILYPEYQGSRFKLEHIYKGKIQGKFITGFLFVREEGMKDFEKLRDFRGKINSRDEMVVDDLPLVRIPSVGTEHVDSSDSKPKFSKVVFQSGARRNHSSGTSAPKKSHLGRDKQGQPAKSRNVSGKAPVGAIPKLVAVNRKIPVAHHKKTDEMLARADRFYSQKDYVSALNVYSSAYRQDNRRLELLYKLGLCHGVLGNRAVRKGEKAGAIEHYSHAIEFWSKATRLDPYNKGAQENIRRARAKLAKLKKD